MDTTAVEPIIDTTAVGTMTEGDTQKPYSLLFAGAKLLFNTDMWAPRDVDRTFFGQKLTMHYPGFFFSSLFWIGVGTSTYLLGRGLWSLTNKVMKYVKSLNNCQRYLQSTQTSQSSDASTESTQKPQTYTAVIYGAGNAAGRLYAHFLAYRGFNLILVERDEKSLQQVEADLKSQLSQDLKITRIVLDKFKFDMDTFNKEVVSKLREHKNSPIKMFVNCKNSRRKLTQEQ
jgi:hypothetical protein